MHFPLVTLIKLYKLLKNSHQSLQIGQCWSSYLDQQQRSLRCFNLKPLWCWINTQQISATKSLVEVTGLEPATYCLQSSRSPSWATPPIPQGIPNSSQKYVGWRYLTTLVGLVGFEPTTPALSTQCSNQLSYRPKSVTSNPINLGLQRQPSNNR